MSTNRSHKKRSAAELLRRYISLCSVFMCAIAICWLALPNSRAQSQREYIYLGDGRLIAVEQQTDLPVPTVSSINPTSATAGGPSFTLSVAGANFMPSSAVRWNGSDRTTTYVSSIQLNAAITAADIASAGTASVTVFNPAPGGGTSGSVPFTINAPNNPVPTLSTINPSSSTAGGSSFTLTATGGSFVSGSVVRWNGSNRTTMYVSAAQLTAQITSADIASAGTRTVTVYNPTPGGGTSNSQTLTVNNPTPTTSGISPTSKTAGDPAFTLTVNGTGFVSGSVVRWNGSNRTTTYVSAAQLTAQITSADIASAGTRTVTVYTPTPGGGTSNSQPFTIYLPQPTCYSMNGSYGFAGIDIIYLTLCVPNIVVDLKYNYTPWGSSTTYYNQIGTIGPTNSSGQVLIPLPQNTGLGTFLYTQMKNSASSEWVNITPPVQYIVRPPMPTSLTVSPSAIQLPNWITLTVGNGQNQTLSIECREPDNDVWVTPFTADQNGQYTAWMDCSWSGGTYTFTTIRNYLDQGSDAYLNSNTPFTLFACSNPYCGDGSCNGSETCATCSQDCGSCGCDPTCMYYCTIYYGYPYEYCASACGCN